ncbi:MAG: glutamate--tRNA ligase [Saprospiraceae bacterium]|nr:glutamate--tRNA ligase [Saprospiraceae bacterium]
MKVDRPVRVRFAPSPTGPLHIGGVRSALYNFLFARKHGGTFILRIEDTDQLRYVTGSEPYIHEALNWLGLIPDEGPKAGGAFGPYRQSERQALYTRWIDRLIDSGHAYLAFDTPEELEQMRSEELAKGVAAPSYDHTVRMRMKNSLAQPNDVIESWKAEGRPYVVRLKIEPEQEIVIHDIIRGEVTFRSEILDDKVLMKADGLPTYHLANVVDDYHMQITHVIRGEEWLSSTAHHVLLYRAFDWEDEMPRFAHLPLILKPSGKGKLSKRDSTKSGIPVFPLDWNDEEEGVHYAGFREKGFLPHATLNFLAFLGWNPGTEQEIFSMEELLEAFDLEQVVKSGARFDYDKALWFNQQYIMHSEATDLLPGVKHQVAHQFPDRVPDDEHLLAFIDLMKERVHTIKDFCSEGSYFFQAPGQYEENTLRKKWNAENRSFFSNVLNLVSDGMGAAEWSATIKDAMQAQNRKPGEIFSVLRIAMTGSMTGPDLFALMAWLGKREAQHRIENLLNHLA